MEEILERCCGIDVHQIPLTACVMIGFGKTMCKDIRKFGTMTEHLTDLGRWLDGLASKQGIGMARVKLQIIASQRDLAGRAIETLMGFRGPWDLSSLPAKS